MITYLRHTQIDKNLWDDCISRSLNRRVYAFSWYLDLVSPGWDALVTDNYLSVFPLTCHRKWGISYLAQPFFTQQLGVFSPEAISESQVEGFLRAIPGRFMFVEIQLNSMNRFSGGSGESVIRANFECDLAFSFEELAGRYAQNTRRNIRKAQESGICLVQTTGVDELISLFRENFGRKEGKLREGHYATLSRLITYCLENKTGHILGVQTKDGVLTAGAFFLFDASRVYFMFAASAPGARENGAMFMLIDRFIAGHAGRNLLLDFEGGNDPNLGRFYRSFGAIEVPYQAVQINRLPKVVESGLYFMRKLRKQRKLAIFVRG